MNNVIEFKPGKPKPAPKPSKPTPEFKPGDVVRLKGDGSVRLTVTREPANASGLRVLPPGGVWVTWFDAEGCLMFADVDPAALMLLPKRRR